MFACTTRTTGDFMFKFASVESNYVRARVSRAFYIRIPVITVNRCNSEVIKKMSPQFIY